MSDTPQSDFAEVHGFTITQFRQMERERNEARRIAEAYRQVWDKVFAAVDETPNPDPLPWKSSTQEEE
jgi:hypothetical protein